jgi:hypothetical protein
MMSTLGPFGIVGVGLIGSAFDVAFCETFFVRSFSAYLIIFEVLIIIIMIIIACLLIYLLACDCLITCCQKINKNLIPSQPAIVPASRGFFTKIVHDMTAGRRARRASSQPATSQPFYLFASFFFFGNKIKAPAHTHAIPLSSSTGRGSGSWEGSHHWKVRTTA